MRRDPFLPLILGLSLWGCSDAVDPPSEGTLAVSTSTSGDDPDPDGFQLTIDGLDSLGLPPSGTIERDLSAGPHSLRLSGVAEQCSIGPGPSVEVDVAAGRTTPVAFRVTCPGTSIRVSLSTIGLDPDPDGYLLTIDDVDSLGLSLQGTAQIKVAPGRHTLQLLDVADHCIVSPGTLLQVDAQRGSATSVAFAIDCPQTGTPPIDGPGARVTVNTIGVDLDGEYWLLVGTGGHGSELRGIPSNGTTTLQLGPGDYVLGLTGVAPNCAIDGPGGHTATITATHGVSVEFAVICTARTILAGVTGNWEFGTTSTAPGRRPLTIRGSITRSGSVVSGAVHAAGSTCFDSLTTIRLTGSQTGSDISLSSTSAARRLTITGSVINESFTGTYSISGCAGHAGGNISGSKALTVNGPWGIIFSANEQHFGGLAGLTQATESVGGTFPIVGAIAGGICEGTITGGPHQSFIMGTSVTLEIETRCGTVIFHGNEAGNEIIGHYRVFGGSYAGLSGPACLTRNYRGPCHLPPF